jgi:acyl-CoA reductase-like NAD-dependent aldehyde dehydrogenase
MTDHKAQIISPVDGRLVASLAYHSQAEIDQQLDLSVKAQAEWAKTDLKHRAALCRALVEALLADKEEIAPELSWQMGRPVRYTGNELNGFAERAHYMIDIAETSLADIVADEKPGFERYISRVPLGLVFVIAAWNYPYMISVNSLIPALMAGNAVILKQASQTLLAGERLVAAAKTAGLADGLLTHLILDHASASELIQDARIAHVNFTGSVDAGKRIQQSAQDRFISVGLELGGKDPAYVRADANLADAIENLVDGSFFNSGQSCCGIERIYVDQSIYDDFVAGFVELTQKYKLGDPLRPETDLGPVINAKAAAEIQGQVDDAIESGAKALIAAEHFTLDPELEKHGTYLRPQVLVNVDHSMRVMRDETFGPVVGIMPVSSDAQAIELMNDSPYGLSACVWTQDMEAGRAIGKQIRTGTFFVNRCDYLDPALSWSGVGDTGRGATLSTIGYEHLTRPMSFHLKS